MKPFEYAQAHASGRYTYTLKDERGHTVQSGVFDNLVTTVGKNLLLTSGLNGSAYTVTGPYLGLISGTSFTAVSAADTMTSHAGWQEANQGAVQPTYSGSRATIVWSPAVSGSISMATAATFSMTNTGTVQGAFLVFGAGASATTGSSGGTCYSCGVFAGGSIGVTNGYVLYCTYSASL
jgi:hypothetical protein